MLKKKKNQRVDLNLIKMGRHNGFLFHQTPHTCTWLRAHLNLLTFICSTGSRQGKFETRSRLRQNLVSSGTKYSKWNEFSEDGRFEKEKGRTSGELAFVGSSAK